MMKKILVLALALCMCIPNLSFSFASRIMVQAQESKTWNDYVSELSTNATMAIALNEDQQKFDGTSVYDVSSYASALATVEEGSVIMRFKPTSIVNHGTIFGTSNSQATLGSDVSAKDSNKTSMVITNQDKFYLVYSYDRAGINGPYSFVDGEWHTVVLTGSSTDKNIRLTIDGNEVWSISNRSDLAGMFSKQTNLDTVTIGGHKNGESIVGGFIGSISDVIVTKEVISDDDAIAISKAGYSGGSAMGALIAPTMLDASIRDNTWTFTGGDAVHGGFEQTRGARNYVGQFEEYIRWRTISGHAYYPRQRYTFSTAYSGQTLADIVNDFENRVATLKTKATVYMLGSEDYNAGNNGISTFKTNLKQFIDQSLALKDNGAFVVIQKPFATNDTTANANIELYNTAIDEVVETFKEDITKYQRMIVVDHYNLTKDDTNFKTNGLTNNKLNAKGHLTISQQFAQKVVNYTGSGYPHSSVVLNRVELAMPEEYLDVQPEVVATTNGLNVTIPSVEGVSSWNYEVIMDNVSVTGNATANTFSIVDLPSAKDYVLKIQSADGKKQIVTTKGSITSGNEAVKNTQVLTEKQQKIVDMVNNKDKPMTWLFMGDSITHASGLTYGYDGIVQIFDEYVKEELGRTKDIVLNTAVANADTLTTIPELDQRLTNYHPDVISIMLGTNDCSSRVSVTVEQFETNMRQIFNTMKTNYPNAVILVRSMTPFFNDSNREPNRQAYMDVVSKLATEFDAIYVDQYSEFKTATSTYSWLAAKLFTDNLHPEANGHRLMAYRFIKACGIWSEDSPMTNLFYSMDIAKETSDIQPSFMANASQIGLSISDLEATSGYSLGDVIMKATSNTNGQTYIVSVKEGTATAILNNLPEAIYDVSVSGTLTNTAKEVTFATTNVQLEETSESLVDVKLSSTKQHDLSVGANVATISVEGLVAEGTYAFELVNGGEYFTIEGTTLKVKQELVEGNEYEVSIKATNGDSVAQNTFVIQAVGEQLIFAKTNVSITQGNAEDLSSQDYATDLFTMEEGTFVIKYTSTSNFGVQSLISIGDGSVQNKHFHIYVTPAGRLGVEIRNDAGVNYHIYKDGAVSANETNIIAFKADKTQGQYKLFVNGELVHTVDASTLGGFEFVECIPNVNVAQLGATKRTNANAYTFGGTIEDIKVYGAALSDDALKEATYQEKEPEKEYQMIFHNNDGTGANYQRIPALLTLKSGRVIAAADERFGGTHDSPNNIDIGVAVSDDDGKTWSNPELVLYFDDFADDELELPRGAQVRVNASASFIDPILFQDATTERVFLIADAMASGYGSPQAVSGSGYKTIDGKTYMQLKKKGESAYNYSIRENGIIYDDTTNTATNYKVNGNYELLKDNVALTVKQKSASYANGAISVTTTDKDVAMNVFYDTADFQVLPTTWLCMKYSDDDGDTWSDPIFLNGQVKNDPERIMIVGPGRGTQLTIGEHAGRLLVPVYNNSFSGVIYSDDHGDTWTYKRGPVTNGVAMSETQFVEMPDGSVRVFARSNNSKIASAISLDGGETWTAAQYIDGLTQPGWGSQLSAIRYSGLIDGKEAIILSSPAGVGSYRRDGHVRIGLIRDTGVEGAERYAIDWTYDYQVDGQNVGYAYSCLTELDNYNVSVLYEKYDSYAPAELHAQNAMIYEELTFDQLMNGDTVSVTPQTNANGHVSKRNTVLKGNEVTIVATADTGYKFNGWYQGDEKVSDDAIYTFALNEDLTLTASFVEKEASDANKEALLSKIEAAQAMNKDNYTTDSVEALEVAITNAISVYNQVDATQEAVDAQVRALQAAIDALVWDGPLPLNPDNLINKAANEVSVENYSSQCGGTGEPTENGTGQAAATVDYNNNTYWHSNWDKNNGENHTITYNLGKEYTLTDVTFLPRQAGRNGDIYSFEVYVGNSTDYTQNTKTGEYVFATSGTLNPSEWYRANVAENGEYKGQYVTIRITGSYGDSGNNKFASMAEIRFYGTEEVVEQANKDALNASIAAAEQLVADDYTEASWNAVAESLAAAKVIAEKEDATQEEVDAALVSLDLAVEKLEEKPVVQETNKTVLKAILDLCETKLAEADKYTDESVAELQRLYNLGMLTYNEPTVSQEVVNSCVARLQEAIAALEEKPQVVVPEMVTDLEAEDTNYKTITLTWAASEGATEYDVYRKSYKEDATFEYEATVSEPIYKSTGVMTGKEYSFYVVAKNEAGEAEASEEVVMATTLKGTVTLAMEKVSTSKFKLSWNKVDGATRYIVYRKRNDDKMKKVLTLGGDVFEYTTAEMPNGEYEFQVKAGRYDSTDRVMTKASNKVSGSVEALKPTVTVTAGTKSAKISWKKMEGVTHYQVYRATSSTGKYTKLVTTKELSYTAKSLTKGKKYYFKVRGYKTYKSGTDIKYTVYTPYSSVKSVTAK